MTYWHTPARAHLDLLQLKAVLHVPFRPGSRHLLPCYLLRLHPMPSVILFCPRCHRQDQDWQKGLTTAVQSLSPGLSKPVGRTVSKPLDGCAIRIAAGQHGRRLAAAAASAQARQSNVASLLMHFKRDGTTCLTSNMLWTSKGNILLVFHLSPTGDISLCDPCISSIAALATPCRVL